MLYGNVAKAEIQGVEVVTDWQLGAKDNVRFSVEYLDARDATSGDRLTERPRWKASASMTSYFGPLRVEGRIRHIRDFWATYDRTVPTYNSDYTTADVSLGYELSQDLSLFGGINNLFDADQPENMAWRGTPDDPAARYYYVGLNAKF